jgi:hypothetical protein
MLLQKLKELKMKLKLQCSNLKIDDSVLVEQCRSKINGGCGL